MVDYRYVRNRYTSLKLNFVLLNAENQECHFIPETAN